MDDLAIKFNEEVKSVKGWILSKDKKSISKVFTKNDNGKVNVYDVFGI